MKQLALAFLFLGLGTAAQAGLTMSDVISNLESTEKAMSSVRFQFQQTVGFTGTGDSSSVKGEALFGKGGRLRITRKVPEEQITISDGRKIWIYTPAFAQVWEGSAKQWLESPAIPKGLIPLDGYVADLKKNFELTLLGVSDDETAKVQAAPKDADAGFSLLLTISTRTWLPVRTEYTSDTARIDTVLTDVQLNPNVSKTAFQFTAPKGVDVIPLN